jgi:hypothetical protein
MRCPSCGTENEPDSRFCGGCGARLTPALPPTQKIDTGAQPVQSAAQPVAQRTPIQEPAARPRTSGAEHVPPASYPMTPSVQRGPSKPQSAQQPVPTPAPSKNGASPASAAHSVQRKPRPSADSIAAPPKRRIGLIIVVLLVDLALAGAGAWMLAEGLSAAPAKPAASTTPGSGSPVKAGSGSSAAVGSAPAANVVASTPDAAPPDAAFAATPPDAAAPIDAAPAAEVVEAKPAKKTLSRQKKKSRKVNKGPVDPYDEGPGDPFPPDITPPPPPPPPSPLP